MAKLSWEKTRTVFKKHWGLYTLLGVYIFAGLLFALLIYRFDWDQATTRLAARVYPLPAAQVNGEFVWLSSFYKRLATIEHYNAQIAAEDPGAVSDEPEVRKQQTLDQLIESDLIHQEARKAGITVSQEEITQSYDKFAADNGGKEAFEKVLTTLYDLTPYRFSQELLKEQLFREKVQTQLFTQVHVRHIVLRDENQAKDALEKAKKGDDFAELAKNFSQDTATRDQGGDLGFIRRGQLDKTFEDAAFSLKVGEITQDLVKTDFGFHIIKVDERKDGPVADKTFPEWLDELKKNAKISRYIAK